jgi:hypothetical protein
MSCSAGSIYLSPATVNDQQSRISMGARGRKTVRKVSFGSALCRIAISQELRPPPDQRRNLNRASLCSYYPSAASPTATCRLMGHAMPSINKGSLGTFVPNAGRSASPDAQGNILMTFLLLYLRAYEFTVRLDRFVGGGG